MNWVMIHLLSFCVLIGLAAIFSATEVAYTGLDRNQLKRIHRLYPDKLSLWEKSPHRVLATLLISNNSVGTAIGVLSASVAGNLSETLHWNESYLAALFSFIAGTLLLMFGEILPKIWAQQFTVSWALGITPFMNRWSRVVEPVAKAATNLTHVLLLGQARQRSSNPFINKSELKRILVHSRLPSTSRKLLDNVMDFGRLTVADVMTSRTDIFSVPIDMPMDKVRQAAIQSGWSRVPVYSLTPNNVMGILYSKDLLVAGRSGDLVVLQDLLRPSLDVVPTMPLPDLLRLFRTKHQHMAVVRRGPEGGPVLGLVTLQDALEALVGHIKEED